VDFVFVSHASEDKPRVRPLVQALAFLGLKVWIDRPGYGQSHFNFDQAFIERYTIQGLRPGADFDQQISEALRESGAVLACLSRALSKDRQVLVHELVIAKNRQKLIACIMDDLPFSDLPADLGLGDASKLQAERIDAEALQVALGTISSGGDAAALSGSAGIQWNVVTDLVRQIRKLMPAEPSLEDMAHAADALCRFPLWPIVRASDIPFAITDIFAETFPDPKVAKRFLSRAMQVRKECNPEGCTDEQILVRDSEVVAPFGVAARIYWDDVLPAAGLKSPRTLAALLVAPGAPEPARLQPDLGRALADFRQWLERPQ
jgi:hypothetical protein